MVPIPLLLNNQPIILLKLNLRKIRYFPEFRRKTRQERMNIKVEMRRIAAVLSTSKVHPQLHAKFKRTR